MRTSGVLGFVGVRGTGLPIPDKQVENIRTLLRHDLPCALYPFLRVGQKVRVYGGALNGIEGILVAVNADRSLVISIELIQRSVVIRIKDYNVQPI
jgi:transcription antitermination factor NusG